ncbi:MAG: septum formation initiator family protein [Ruminococcaceae bacterium]|nr:septum formation initiator family protein [Oscillospiraceae bacterium]
MQKKRRKQKVNMRKMLVRLAFVGILCHSSYILASQQLAMYRKQKDVEKWEETNNAAIHERAKLEEERELAGTPEYKEQKARELLGYVRPEETIYIDVTK